MFCPSPIYIQVTSHINPSPNICISHPSRWCLSLMCVTHPSRSCLTCIQITISLSHLHPCTVSLPPRSEVSCLICIHVTSHLQPTHFHSSHDICITAPSMSYLTPIHVSILAPELHPDHVSPPSRSHDQHFISIQVAPQPYPAASQFQSGPISTPSSSLDGRLTSIHVPAHLHSVSYSCIPPPSTSCLTSTKVLIYASHLHPCWVSSPGGEMRDLQLSSIHVPSIDESLNNPLQFLHLILFSIIYRHSKSLCVYHVWFC